MHRDSMAGERSAAQSGSLRLKLLRAPPQAGANDYVKKPFSREEVRAQEAFPPPPLRDRPRSTLSFRGARRGRHTAAVQARRSSRARCQPAARPAGERSWFAWPATRAHVAGGFRVAGLKSVLLGCFLTPPAGRGRMAGSVRRQAPEAPLNAPRPAPPHPRPTRVYPGRGASGWPD